MWSKVLVGLGMAAVLGLMGAGIVYAVSGAEGDGWAREGYGGRWSTAEAAATGGRWAAGGSVDDGPTGQSGGTGARWPGEGASIDGPQALPGELVSLSGVVESLEDSELVVRTEAGELVEVALGPPAYWEAQGVSLAIGEAVVIEGSYEDEDTLAAHSVTPVTTGQTIVLRDANGRPMWAGGRWNVGAGTAPTF